MNRALRMLVASTCTAVLAGCATFSRDGGMDDVRKLAEDRVGAPAKVLSSSAATDDASRRAAVERLMAEPLTADRAVEIALLANPALQIRLAEVGVVEADLVQAGRLRNPVFAYSSKRNSDVKSIERALLVNVAALVTMPLALDIEQRRFEQAKVAAAAEIVATAAAARDAYFRAVAARESALYAEKAMRAAEAASELARRMAEVGNFSKLQQMREQAFYADAAAQLARARLAAAAEREQLARMLGAPSPAAFVLPDRLPELPIAPLDERVAEQAAMDRRLDVQLARLQAEGMAKSLGLTKATRFVNVFEAGYVNESETGESRKDGYEIELELPIFDFGEVRIARAELLYKQAVARTAETGLAARSEVREAWAGYATAYALARHYRDEIVPLRKRIAEENLLRYNGMLIGVFELLADTREQLASLQAAIDAQRDHWLAESALQAALAGKSAGGGSRMSMTTPRAAAAPAAH